MAIFNLQMKSSASAPPSAAHAAYITRDGQYKKRGGVALIDSGNMPEFAKSDPHVFWRAADSHERANGRAYTELQIALPRELNHEKRVELVKMAVREFMGDRFAYTLAVHNPLAHDKIEQPHLHLMFSERVVDERSRALSEEQFFKRNGAKKDRGWSGRSKPEEIRSKWCEMMNRAMEREGVEERVDHRSWDRQGRGDLAELVEPKELRGDGRDAVERREEIARLRELRRELPAPHLDGAEALQQIEAEAEAQIVAIEMKLQEELGLIDRLIAKAKETMEKLSQRAKSVFGGGPAPVFARAARAVPLSREELQAAEKVKSILSMMDRLATREQGAAWIDKQISAREQEIGLAIRRSAQYQSGRALFESQASIDEGGFMTPNGEQLPNLDGLRRRWQKEANRFEARIAAHPQTKSRLQRILYEPDPQLKEWRAEADRAREFEREYAGKHAKIEAQWSGHENEWSAAAAVKRDANEKQIERWRREIGYLKDAREPVLRELARRDADPLIQAERETLRLQQKQKVQQRQRGRGDSGMER
jgi:hypothetical protein